MSGKMKKMKVASRKTNGTERTRSITSAPICHTQLCITEARKHRLSTAATTTITAA